MSDKITDEMRSLFYNAIRVNAWGPQRIAELADEAFAIAAQAHPTDEEEVERVARAIYEASADYQMGGDWAGLSEGSRRAFHRVARAALNAIGRK